MWAWFKRLETRLQDDLEAIRAREAERTSYGSRGTPLEVEVLPFLQLVEPSKMALTVILVLMRMMGTGGVAHGIKTTRALISVGRAIEQEYHVGLTRSHPEIFTNAKAAHEVLRKRGLLDHEARRNLRQWQRDQAAAGGVGGTGHAAAAQWSQSTRAKVGSYLVQHLMAAATVVRRGQDRDGVQWVEDQPAFYSAYQYVQGKKLGVIRANDVVAKRLDRESLGETFHARHLPMLVPPRLWLSHDSGGYLSMKTSAMRYKDSAEQGSYLREASDNHHLETVLAGLDVLGSTPWVVNNKVLDVMTRVWNAGTDVADMPPLEPASKEPERPADYETDLKARATYLGRLKHHHQERANNHSQRCDVNYKLEIARAFAGERFFFPHNMDFRGRAYPIPPHLNHMGNDLCRGLLLFADAKPLGRSGLRWLRIHLANVYGYDKASFAEREQFAIDHEADVRAAVADPLAESGSGRWWLAADDPWQCLATCFELVAALDHPEGPEAYESQLPVHQDGTCNGLQHYAALGGDLAGAKQVNLSQGERPSDVYTGVADLVIEQLARDAAGQSGVVPSSDDEGGSDEGSGKSESSKSKSNGKEASANSDSQRLARILEGKVTRKVVKQTVMTTVYGVTFIGAKNQVQRQLADRGDIAHEDLWQAASYLAKVIMNCIGDLFTGAELIQHWLHESAFLIAKSIPPARIQAMDGLAAAAAGTTPGDSDAARLTATTKARALDEASKREQMTSVIWTTPLDLPVVQPYRKVTRRQVMTAMRTVFLHDPQTNTQVSPPKQASAFPPNFIHSLDATHMMLTALECRHIDLTFAAVHDSYWTHACDIDTMSELIRDTFVRLHSRNLLGELRDEFLDRYPWALPPIPTKGSFDVKETRNSLYFFS
ncbi:hypothetical protein L7F22_011520 [Adiantum nelumboides]|nr:hypothetical protein [Adiantum nelumboides]